MADKKPEIITVKSALPDNRLAIHERDDAHPDGEIFVYGDKEFQVARTAEVSRHLAAEELVEVSKGKSGKSSDPE